MRKEGSKKRLLLIVMIIICVMSLIPIIYCALFYYATGDDFWKSANVHQMIVRGASFFAIIAQAGRDAVDVWRSFEGTWASNFVLALQPGIWGEKFYILTPFIGLAFLFVGIGAFLYEVLVQRLEAFSKKVIL